MRGNHQDSNFAKYEMHYLVYQTKHKESGKIYIGVHQTNNTDDGYLGSGRYLLNAIQKHGPAAFEKTILHDCATVEEMYAKEGALVTEEFVSRSDTYNLKVGGEGGWDYCNVNGLGSIALKHLWKNDPVWSEKLRQTLSERQRKYIADNGSWWSGKTHKTKTKQKQSSTAKASKQYAGVNNPSFGKRWMTNGKQSDRISLSDQQHYVDSGWKFGRIIKPILFEGDSAGERTR